MSKVWNQIILVHHIVPRWSTHCRPVQVPKQRRLRHSGFGKMGAVSAQCLVCLVSLTEQTQSCVVIPQKLPLQPRCVPLRCSSTMVQCPSTLYKTVPTISERPVCFPFLICPIFDFPLMLSLQTQTIRSLLQVSPSVQQRWG